MKKLLIVLISSLFLFSCTLPIATPDQIQKKADEVTDVQVSLPTGMDVINLFWQLINEHRISEAIDMMSLNLIKDDTTKQAYGVQFNHIKSVNVTDIKPFDADTWTTDYQLYEVTLEIYVSSDAANAPIPYYGYGDNPNTRFISLSKDSLGKWQIDSIATGP